MISGSLEKRVERYLELGLTYEYGDMVYIHPVLCTNYVLYLMGK